MKEKILRFLKENKNSFISGQLISAEIGISRTAVWKYINILKNQGYIIQSVSNKGYRLVQLPDILNYEEISPFLKTKYIGRNIYYFDEIESTNDKGKEIAYLENKEGSLIIAESQTKGRGRMGRQWFSPKGSGIYMSLILRPNINPAQIAAITLVGACAVFESIKKEGITPYIKWPNDILINNKKVCGILTEMSGELNNINYLVMGIGINVNLTKDQMPKEINDIATSLEIEAKRSINRQKFVGNVLNSFEKYYNEFKEYRMESIINMHKQNSILIGKKIKIINRDKITKAKAIAIDIDSNGALIVQYENGKIDKVISGEISIRDF